MFATTKSVSVLKFNPSWCNNFKWRVSIVLQSIWDGWRHRWKHRRRRLFVAMTSDVSLTHWWVNVQQSRISRVAYKLEVLEGEKNMKKWPNFQCVSCWNDTWLRWLAMTLPATFSQRDLSLPMRLASGAHIHQGWTDQFNQILEGVNLPTNLQNLKFELMISTFWKAWSVPYPLGMSVSYILY